ARSTIRFLRSQRSLHRRDERIPSPCFALVEIGLRAIRIVEVKDRALREQVRATLTDRMLRISLDFCRTSFMTARQHWNGVCAESKRGRVVHRTPEHHALRLLYIGHDRLRWHLRAAAQPSERQRCTHQLKKVSTRNFAANPLGSLARKFLVQKLLEFL